MVKYYSDACDPCYSEDLVVQLLKKNLTYKTGERVINYLTSKGLLEKLLTHLPEIIAFLESKLKVLQSNRVATSCKILKMLQNSGNETLTCKILKTN